MDCAFGLDCVDNVDGVAPRFDCDGVSRLGCVEVVGCGVARLGSAAVGFV